MTIQIPIVADNVFDLHRQLKDIATGDQNTHYAPLAASAQGSALGAKVAFLGREADAKIAATVKIAADFAEQAAKEFKNATEPPKAAENFAAPQVERDAGSKVVIEPKKTRGRPKKTQDAPAGALVEESVVPADQAQVSINSASAPAVLSPAAEGAQEAAVETVAPQAVSTPSLTFEQFKAVLQEVQAAAPENLGHVIAVLHEFGYQKVKEVEPEHFDAIADKAREFLP